MSHGGAVVVGIDDDNDSWFVVADFVFDDIADDDTIAVAVTATNDVNVVVAVAVAVDVDVNVDVDVDVCC